MARKDDPFLESDVKEIVQQILAVSKLLSFDSTY